MNSPTRFRSLSTVAGVLGLVLLLFAFVMKALAVVLFMIAAFVFILALVLSLMAARGVARER